jgi:hypothetical protein
MDLEEIECEGVTWIHFPQDRVLLQAVMNTVMNLCAPQQEGKFFNA